MDLKWQDVQNRLVLGSKDYKCICESIRSMADYLEKDYKFEVYLGDGSKVNIKDNFSLEKKMKVFLEQTKVNYLNELKRLGRINAGDFEGYFNNITDRDEQKKLLNYLKLRAWQISKGYFLETLCLLAVLKKFRPAASKTNDFLLFKKIGPIPISDKGKLIFLWYQPTVKISKSGMPAKPDIVLTNTDKDVSKETITSIIECKCRENISASDLRNEFGKAFDLEVNSYLIVTYYSVSQSLIEAAKRLGIELIDFGLYSAEREKYLQRETMLEEVLSNKIVKSYEESSFSQNLSKIAAIAKEKILQIS